jgi:glucose-6-phosphate-specific signal transduction histidine kinase
MGPLDAVWHLASLFLPALMLGTLAAALAKLLWRRELAGVPWRRLAVAAAAAAAAVVLLGLVVFGRDGRMATYAGMVLATAGALWWRGFGPGR